MPIQVWKIPINSQRPDFLNNVPNEPPMAERARQFCFRGGWVGIGWGIDGLNRDLQCQAEYEELFRDHAGNGIVSTAINASRRFANKMQRGDFIWCRARGDQYWLGRIEGSWEYHHDGDFKRFDVFQARKCLWISVGAGDCVPGPVKNAYAGRGSTVSRILAEGEAALLGSVLIWEREVAPVIEYDKSQLKELPLGAIAHDDLEDIVSLYLQRELEWYVVPSTVKKSTPVTEFVLRNAERKRAYIQVKSGAATIDSSTIIVPNDVDIFYVFYPSIGRAAPVPDANPKICNIDPDNIMKFIKTNRNLMPSFVSQLMA